MPSDAVSIDRISRVVGYKLTKGFFNTVGPNLPQRIALLGEANDANQVGLNTSAPVQITSAAQAALLYGAGSPIHMAARILFPFSGDGVGSIPVYVYPQARAAGATSKLWSILPSGVATANVTHFVKVAGRNTLDNQSYAINIVAGDTATQILPKILAAVNGVYGCPVLATSDAYQAYLTSRWRGITANEINVQIDNNGNSAGVSYSVQSPQAGSGTPSIAAALSQFGTDWNTIVLSCYGLESTTVASLNSVNGRPDPNIPTGRYGSTTWRPFVAICGSIADDPSSITDLLLDDCTIAVAPAPGSLGTSIDAAANMTYLYALQAQNNPHLDVAGQFYPDMPLSVTWASASMASYTNRDVIVKKGCSTVNMFSTGYRVEDFVTTYHPVGETPPQYRYVRNLNIDMNVRYGYFLLEQINVVSKAIAKDSDVIIVDNVIKPKQWKAVLTDYAVDLAQRALIVDSSFMATSLVVNLGASNPDRLETFFRYKRSGFARIASTTAQAGFNFGG